MIRFVLLALLWCGGAAAQTLPALYDVSGVDADDELVVRAMPSVQADRLGGLAPDETGVEITAFSNDWRWGRLNLREGTGWVSISFLVQAGTGNAPLPERFQCFGTEPFWSLGVVQNGVTTLSVPEEPDRGFATGPLLVGTTRSGPILGLGGFGLAVVLHRQECSDGMSDRLYGLSADVLLSGPATIVSGCCSLHLP